MNTPFTAEQFLEIFKIYNQAVWPMQIVFYFLGIVAIYLTFNPTPKSHKVISGLLFFFWLCFFRRPYLILFLSLAFTQYNFWHAGQVCDLVGSSFSVNPQNTHE